MISLDIETALNEVTQHILYIDNEIEILETFIITYKNSVSDPDFEYKREYLLLFLTQLKKVHNANIELKVGLQELIETKEKQK